MIENSIQYAVKKVSSKKFILGCGLVIVVLNLLGLSSFNIGKIQAQTPSLIANPYFDNWSIASPPDQWNLIGGAQVAKDTNSYDSARSGPNNLAKVTGTNQGDGIIQRAIPVKPSTRYDFYTWVKVPNAVTLNDFQFIIKGENSTPSATLYSQGAAYETTNPSIWKNITKTFTTGPNETSISVEFTRTTNKSGALVLFLDNTTLYERITDTSPSIVAKPAKPIILYGMEQNFDRSTDIDTIVASNVFDNAYQTHAFVNKLRDLGKVAAQRVYVPANATVDELVALWSQPFRDTMEGRITNGLDAISMDELGGAWDDSNQQAVTIAQAIQQTKALYPNRYIYIWGTWYLGNGGPSCWYHAPCPTYDKLLTAINQYADEFMLEDYAPEANPQLDNAKFMAQNITDRAVIAPQIAGILQKTSFGLGIYQTTNDFTADDTPTLDFKAFLDERLHRIHKNVLSNQTNGIALWPYYDATPDSMNWINNLTTHYVTQGSTTYLGAGRDNTTGYNGDGKYLSLLANNNPSFETVNGSWKKSSGSVTYVSYVANPSIPNFHGSVDSKVLHGSTMTKMVKKNNMVTTLTQTVAIKPSTSYEIDAYVIGGKTNTSAQIQVTDPRGTNYLSKTSNLTNLSTSGWTKIGFVFTTPATGTEVIITLSDANGVSNNTSYWDYVELTEKTNFDVFQPAITPASNGMKVEWFTDLPATSQIQYGATTAYGTTSPLIATLTTYHSVTVAGLTPSTQYHLRTISTIPDTGNSHSSFDFAVFTLPN